MFKTTFQSQLEAVGFSVNAYNTGVSSNTARLAALSSWPQFSLRFYQPDLSKDIMAVLLSYHRQSKWTIMDRNALDSLIKSIATCVRFSDPNNSLITQFIVSHHLTFSAVLAGSLVNGVRTKVDYDPSQNLFLISFVVESETMEAGEKIVTEHPLGELSYNVLTNILTMEVEGNYFGAKVDRHGSDYIDFQGLVAHILRNLESGLDKAEHYGRPYQHAGSIHDVMSNLVDILGHLDLPIIEQLGLHDNSYEVVDEFEQELDPSQAIYRGHDESDDETKANED